MAKWMKKSLRSCSIFWIIGTILLVGLSPSFAAENGKPVTDLTRAKAATQTPNQSSVNASKSLFTFHVPVSLNKLNSNVDNVYVSCKVTANNTLLTRGVKAVPMQGNSYSGTVSVFIDKIHRQGATASMATDWECSLIFTFEEEGWETVANNPIKGVGMDPIWVTHDPNTKAIVQVKGTFTN